MMDDDNLSYEPMDVDLSTQSANAMDISYNDSNVNVSLVKTEKLDTLTTDSSFDVIPENINTLTVDSMENHNASVARNNAKHKSIILLSLTFLIVAIISYQIANFNCCEKLNFKTITHNLTTRLYGQIVAVKNILEALASKEDRKVLLFYGGTGVGKTFATSLILENLYGHKNIYHYTMPRFLQTFSSELMLGLLFCKSAIVILDDLTRNDISSVVEPLRNFIIKSEELSKKVTIILLYNCDVVNETFFRKCDDSFHAELERSLLDMNAQKYFIKFEPLTEEHLRKCIANELLDRELYVRDIDRIVKNFNVTLDGCKGVHQKLQYLKTV